MNVTDEIKNPTDAGGLHRSTENVPMHPDDFEAHLAWIRAKRFSEPVLKETGTEKPCTAGLSDNGFTLSFRERIKKEKSVGDLPYANLNVLKKTKLTFFSKKATSAMNSLKNAIF